MYLNRELKFKYQYLKIKLQIYIFIFMQRYARIYKYLKIR